MDSSVAQADTNPARVESATKRGMSQSKWHLLIIFAIWLALYIPGLFTPALLDDADSVHAEAAREMLLRHDWSTLYINGFRYLEKAPLPYWGIAIMYKLFGVSEWTARFPLTLGLLGLLLSAYFFGKRYIGERAGFYSAIILALSFGPYIFTRILIPDVLVGWFLLIGFDFFLRGLQEERPSLISCWGLAVATALNVLTKGLIGVVFPVGMILAFLLITGNLRHFLKMRLVSSFLVFFAIAAPWHIVAGIRNPAAGQSKGFFWFYFVNEHFLRYLNERFPKDYDTVPLGLFWGVILVWLMPWSAFLFKGLGQVPVPLRAWFAGVRTQFGVGGKLRRLWANLGEYGRSLDSRRRALLLCAIWALVILVFFSFSSRQEYYNIPAIPGFAIIIGAWLAQEEAAPAGSRIRRAGRRVAAIVLGIAAPVFAVASLLLWYSDSVPKGTDLSTILTKNPEQYALSFGHILDLTPQAMGLFRIPLALTALSFLFGSLFAWWFRSRGQVGRSNAALALMMLVFLHCAHAGLATFDPVLSSKTLSQAISRVYKPGDIVVVNGAYEDASTLNFYGHFQLHVINTRTNGNLYYGSLFPDSPKIFENDQSFAKLWRGPERVFLWCEADHIPATVQHTSFFQVAHAGGKLILSNQPNR
jgi:4-amino-4-deoxy-L-arabinose transferase-like glycosyltransferase